MEAATCSAETLRTQIAATELQLIELKKQLDRIETEGRKTEASNSTADSDHPILNNPAAPIKWPLTPEEYQRYGRQMIVPGVGIQGQLRLKAASVLLVGAGGLGCPAAAYIAGAGVGTIGIVDGDEVETSNLHRQILHSTARVRMKKVDSIIQYLTGLNPNLIYKAHPEHLSSQNAESIVSQYDLVLDCTDHPTSRYLISDICVLLQKPLVSASALRTDGQLIVLNSPPVLAGNATGGPCYRCIFPTPPPAESVVSCGDGGILGPVVGVMGVLQALEALKLITSGSLTGTNEVGEVKATGTAASMLIFSANSPTPFRSLKMRPRRAGCFACSSEASLTLESLSGGSLDYVLFCGIANPVHILRPDERIEAKEYAEMKGDKHLLVDVRERVQFDICNIEGSINVPFSTFQGSAGSDDRRWIPEELPPNAPIYIVCRLGNDSQVVTRKLKESGLDVDGRYIGDIKGGLRAWKAQVDSSWPEY